MRQAREGVRQAMEHHASTNNQPASHAEAAPGVRPHAGGGSGALGGGSGTGSGRYEDGAGRLEGDVEGREHEGLDAAGLEAGGAGLRGGAADREADGAWRWEGDGAWRWEACGGGLLEGEGGAGDRGDARGGDLVPPRREELACAFFADESEAFREPAEPALGERVTIRLRVDAGVQVRAELLVGASANRVPLVRVRADGMFTWHEATLRCGLDAFGYRYLIHCEGDSFVLQRGGVAPEGEGLDAGRDFRIAPGTHVPSWSRGALQYQIFPERFANGDAENDVVSGEYDYDGEPVRRRARWEAPPAADDFRCFYGGDLQGIAGKLDYLQGLGVEALYLNPIFVAPSSHKYDTQDYEHVDPHLAAMPVDSGGADAADGAGAADGALAGGGAGKGGASSAAPSRGAAATPGARYVVRTTSPENLQASDALFAQLCQELHRRGMRIILDGVFNHCGSFSRWMDREGIYAAAGAPDVGAYWSHESPYRGFFSFTGPAVGDYEGWWDFPTLPKLNYENSEELVERVLGIARKWAQPPYCIDGWRLDVAADLGHSEAFNHAFWRRFRAELKRVNPELLIVAEHYGSAAAWLGGDEWDSVMNYDAFMDPLSYFLTGMEKHSDYARDDLYQDGTAFWRAMRAHMAQFGWGSLLSAMNELSNHDHSRFLTRTNRTAGRLHTAGAAAAGEGVDKRVLREAVVVQMCWPGAPTIYYGDEAGQVGWTDPDCRRTFPWGEEDAGLVELHRTLARVREARPCLRSGSFAPLGGGEGWIAFGRFSSAQGAAPGAGQAAVVCNNADHPQRLRLRLRTLGVPEGQEVAVLLETTEGGFVADGRALGRVEGGYCELVVPARSALVVG